LDSKGLGNEIGFWIFDYPPDRESGCAGFVTGTVFRPWPSRFPPMRAAKVDLLQLVTELAGRAKSAGQSHGDAAKTRVTKARWPLCARCSKKTRLPRKLPAQHDIANLDLLVLTGVGAVYPMLRTHTLLSALHPIMGNTPLLMFFPRALRRPLTAPVQYLGRRPLLPGIPPGSRTT
jgi:hypothetical protein